VQAAGSVRNAEGGTWRGEATPAPSRPRGRGAKTNPRCLERCRGRKPRRAGRTVAPSGVATPACPGGAREATRGVVRDRQMAHPRSAARGTPVWTRKCLDFSAASRMRGERKNRAHRGEDRSSRRNGPTGSARTRAALLFAPQPLQARATPRGPRDEGDLAAHRGRDGCPVGPKRMAVRRLVSPHYRCTTLCSHRCSVADGFGPIPYAS